MLHLAADQVHVWYLFPEQSGPEPSCRSETLLSREELDRNRRFVFAEDRQRHLVAHVLVRTTLSRYADIDASEWTFQHGDFGRPEIAGPRPVPLRFSLSHTRGMVAVAVTSTADVGIDTENVRERGFELEIARRYFTPREAAELDSLPTERRHRAFLEYWTLKEACLKAAGRGLSLSLDSFCIRLGDPPVVTEAPPEYGHTPDWHLWHLALSPLHVTSLAVRKTGTRPSVSIRQHGLSA